MGLFGRKKEPASATSKDADNKVYSSQAAAALAAAASSSGSATTKAGPQPTGRCLEGTNVVVDLDDLKSSETIPELQVQPITLLKFDYKLEHTQQVAISNNYICYGLKAGHIRALNRNTASRALFKGHTSSLSYMAFFSPDSGLLASCSCSGDVTVRQVSDESGAEGDAVPTETLMLTGQLPMGAGGHDTAAAAGALVTLAWHPSTSQILAAAAGNAVYIFEVPISPPAEVQPAVAPGIKYNLPAAAATGQVTSLAFSPAGDLLVAADSMGYVHAWWLEGDEELHGPVLSWQPYGQRSGWEPAVASVHFLHQAADNSSLLLTGDATNQTLKLWLLPAAGSAVGPQQAQPVCLQTVTFKAAAQGAAGYFCHAVMQAELQLVILGNTVRKQVYTLHYSVNTAAATAMEAAARLDYAAFFSVKQPILSLAPALESVESQAAAPGEVQAQQLLLYCVQTEGIQQYMVSPLLCSSRASMTAAPVDAAAAVDDAMEEGEEVSSVTAVPAGAAEPPAAAAVAAADGDGKSDALQSTAAGQAVRVKAEMTRALKSSETAFGKQVDVAVKASAKKSEEERRKAAGKERQELEKVLALQLEKVAGSLQRDISKLVTEVAREQARTAVTATVNAVTPAMAAAVTTGLQRELAGGSQLQLALERSLASSLGKSLHDALREDFAGLLIPAFERATQVMFNQVQDAFTSWLADSSRLVSSSQSEAASALTSAVSQLQSVVGSVRGDLADTSRSLNRLASSTAQRVTAAEGSGGGGGVLSVAQLEAGTRAAAPVVQDPRVEIQALLTARKYDEALVKTLNTASLHILLWACKQVDAGQVLSGTGDGLSQTTLLSLVHQLSANLVNDADTPLKLTWLAEAAPVVDPHDPVTAPHLKGVLTGVMNSLKGLVNSLPANDAMAKKGKITLHLFNSLLHQ
eukprot:gene11820-11964_t